MEGIIILIYPWSNDLAESILDEFDRIGKRRKCLGVCEVPLDVIRKHYVVHSDKEHFQRMTEDWAGKNVVIAEYEGDREKFAALKMSLRGNGKYVPFPRAPREMRHRDGVVHTSRDDEEYAIEKCAWARYLDICSNT